MEFSFRFGDIPGGKPKAEAIGCLGRQRGKPKGEANDCLGRQRGKPEFTMKSKGDTHDKSEADTHTQMLRRLAPTKRPHFNYRTNVQTPENTEKLSG